MGVHHNFLITGFGRSGTKFLSSVMNRSELFTVLHEPRGAEDEVRIPPTPSQLEAFSQDFYGEVNSRMRFAFYDVQVRKRGIILRDPLDIILSIANRKPLPRLIELIGEVHDWYQTFYRWIHNDESIFPISFHRMTTDKEYLQDVAKHFDITDIDWDKVDITKKVNTNLNQMYKNYGQLPDPAKEEYHKYQW